MLEYVQFPDDTPLIPSDNPQVQYHYEDSNDSGLVTGMTDELGVRYTTYTYDSSGRATLSERVGSVESTSVVYNGNGTVTVTNELGKLTDYTFTEINHINRVTSLSGQATSLCGASMSARTHDTNGFIDTETDENGNVTDYSYNARGLVVSQTDASGTSGAVTTATTWHTDFNVPTQIVKPGQTIDLTYDPSGRLLTRTITDTQTQTVPYVTTGNTRTTTYSYNAQGLIATIDGPRTDASDVTTYTYDTNTDLLTVSNALGHVTVVVSRDAAGRPTAIDDANNLRTELRYDPRGRLISRTVKSGQGDVVTSFSYDDASQLIRIDLPTGGYLAYEYDDAHRLVAIENEHEERVEYTLDNAGNAKKIEHVGPGGAVLQVQDQLFDELSRLRTLTDGLSNATDFDVDLNGNVTQITDALSRETDMAYDAFNQLEMQTDAASGVTTQTYDERGNLLTVTDPKGVVTTYIYDGLDNLIQEVSADSGTTTYVYDSAGNLTQSTDGRGVVTNYTYDALNRMLTVVYPGSTSENITYAYDAGTNGIGRLSSFVDESGSTGYLYDDRGNVTQDQRVVGNTTYTTGYSYNLVDHLVSTIYPSGRVVNATLDTQGRLTGLSHTLNSVTEYLVDNVQYDGRGYLELLGLSNGINQVIAYDDAGGWSSHTLTDSYNAVPIAYSDAVNVTIGSVVDIDVIANDKDFNGDNLTIHNLTQPSLGSVALNGDQTIEYTPAGSTEYQATFTYQVTDGAGPSNFATVTVTVVDPGFVDTDGDGLSDTLETSVGLNPNDAADAVADADGDGVDNYDEYLAGTDPLVNDSGTAAATSALNPLAFWELDETTGSTAASSSGVHNGSYVSTHTKGANSVQETGTAVSFDGGYVSIPHHSDLNMAGDYTFETLVRWTGTEYAAIFYKIPASSPYYGVFITTHSSGKIRFWEGPSAYLYSDTALNDGAWKHLTFVRRGQTLEIWVNGELDASATASQDAITTTTGLYLMGRNYSYMKLKGDMDTFAIHTQALTPAQIKSHFLSLGDKDLDTVPTSFEIAHGHDATDASDATEDYDGDGATLYDEYAANTHPMLHPQGYNGAVLADAPIGFWPLDDVTTTATDATGNGHIATYNGTYTQSEPGAITEGSSLTLAGGSVVTNTAHIDFEPQGDYTIEAYLKWSDTGYNSIIGSWDSSAVGPFVWKNLNGCCTSNGRITVRDKNQSGYYLGSYSTGLNDGNWRHYAFIRRGNQLEIWIDGVLDKTGTLPSVIAHDTDGFFRVIRDEGGADQVAYYDYALQPADIRQHIIQGQEPPPVVHVNGKKLPKSLDRWLESGTLIALYDEPLQTMELFRVSKDGDYESIEYSAALFSHTKVRAIRQKDQVTVYLNRTAQDDWLKQVRNTTPQIHLAASAGLNETWSLTYDAARNLTQIAKPAGNETFGYDALDRLSNYTLPSSAQVTYTYDATGNRLTETQSGITQTHTYGSSDNRLITQTGLALTYDGAGNPLSDQSGTRVFTYGHANRLSTVTISSALVGTYTYNALGQRARKVAGTVDIDYIYGLQGQLLGEYVDGIVVREYVYANGTPIGQIDSATTWLHTNHLGTPRLGTNSNGTIVWRWDSDPFGESTPFEDPDGDMTDVTVPLRFPGQYADVETGQYYNYFRTYDPSIGRYTQSDPIGLAGGLNTYAYVSGNPISHTDFFGLADSFTRAVANAVARGDTKALKNLLQATPQSKRDAVKRALDELNTKADDFIAQNCKGSVRQEFPGQFLGSTRAEIKQAARAGDRFARKADKLLNQQRFRK
ncbi:MAG: LamG-like jellyroll fold domain-containing protein [Pseudomonadales bacterium]